MSGAQLDASVDAINLSADFGVMYNGGGDGKIFYNTTEYWEEQTELVPEAGTVYIYSDYKQDENDNYVVGVKVGDGTTLLSELTFTDELVPTKTSQLDNDSFFLVGKKKTDTLRAGETQLVFTDAFITSDKDIFVMSDIYYTEMVQGDGTCTLTFPEQETDELVRIIII